MVRAHSVWNPVGICHRKNLLLRLRLSLQISFCFCHFVSCSCQKPVPNEKAKPVLTPLIARLPETSDAYLARRAKLVSDASTDIYFGTDAFRKATTRLYEKIRSYFSDGLLGFPNSGERGARTRVGSVATRPFRHVVGCRGLPDRAAPITARHLFYLRLMHHVDRAAEGPAALSNGLGP